MDQHYNQIRSESKRSYFPWVKRIKWFLTCNTVNTVLTWIAKYSTPITTHTTRSDCKRSLCGTKQNYLTLPKNLDKIFPPKWPSLRNKFPLILLCSTSRYFLHIIINYNKSYFLPQFPHILVWSCNAKEIKLSLTSSTHSKHIITKSFRMKIFPPLVCKLYIREKEMRYLSSFIGYILLDNQVIFSLAFWNVETACICPVLLTESCFFLK